MRTQIGISVYRQNLYQVESCINSCLSQGNCIVTCRADGPESCNPDVLEFLKSVSDANPCFYLILGGQRLGCFGSLNRIFKTSDTEFLCQLDADDLLAPGALRICSHSLDKHQNASFVYTDCLEIDDCGSPIKLGERSLKEYTEINSLIQFIPFHLRLIRRSSFDKIGGYNSSLRYTGDYDLSLKLAEVGDVVYLNRPLYFYRTHSQNTSTTNSNNINAEVLDLCRAALVRRGLSDKYRLIQGEKGEMTIISI